MCATYLVFSFDHVQLETVTCARMCGDDAPVVKRFELLSNDEIVEDLAVAQHEHESCSRVAEQPTVQRNRFE